MLYKEIVKKISVGVEKKLKQKQYLKEGSFEVVDQGQSLIGGYSNDSSLVVKCDLPVIIFGDHTKCVKFIDFPFVAGADGVKVLQAKDGVDSKYLYYCTLLLTKKIVDKGYARHYQFLEKMEVDIPSLSEQKRIVNKIEELFSELDSAVETLKKTKEQLAVYRQSVLKEAFEEITKKEKLVNLSDRIFDGPFGSNLKSIDYIQSGIRVVRLENLKEGWFDDSKQSFVSKEKYETIKMHTVFPSDLIMSTFISESVKVCQMPHYIGFAVNKADCIGIRLKPDFWDKYVMFYLLSRKAYLDLEHQIHGATRPRVNTTQIKQLLIPICTKEEQKTVVAEIEKKFSVCDNIAKTVNDALAQAEAMRQSILKKAFDGGL